MSNAFSKVNQLFAFGSFRNWIKLFYDNRGINPAYTGRLLFVVATSLSTAPLRVYERIRYGKIIEKVEIKADPIFILGHWRSGTTYLHDLLIQDKNFGYTSTFQTTAPGLSLVGEKTIKPLLSKVVPSTRIGDNMALRLDGPQEEEFALAGTTLYSFYHQWSFPQNARDYFKKYVLFQDMPETVIASWQQAYLTTLRKATFKSGSKRLVLKNPVNTGRIGILLDMFPQAKFIHIYRNPYHVFLSMRHFYEKLLGAAQFQSISREEIEANTLWFFEKMMQKFLADKSLIPPENFVELRFEDLEANPLAELRRIYTALNLPGFSEAEMDLRAYITAQTHYQKNTFNLNSTDIHKVNQHWHFVLDEWNYDPEHF